MYTISKIKRKCKKKKLDKILIKVGKYFIILNDVKLKLTDFQKEYLSVIDNLKIPDCDKCFLISNLLCSTELYFLSFLYEYEEKRKELTEDKPLYRLMVNMYLSKEERKLIHDKLETWYIMDVNEEWKTKDYHMYHIPSNTLLIRDENDYSTKAYVDGTKILENCI